MIVSDAILRDPKKFDEYREFLRDEACGFCRDAERNGTTAKYWGASQSVYRGLTVQWDHRRLANKLNLDASENELKTSQLYEADALDLFAMLQDNHVYDFQYLFNQEYRNILLRVIYHWSCGDALTPPMLMLVSDGKFVKVDGFHRLSVAFAAEVATIPFWAVLEECPKGIRRIPCIPSAE